MALDINIARIEDFIDRHYRRQASFGGGVPSFASIEFSINAMCNRRCIFCPRVDPDAFPNLDSHLSIDAYRKVIDDVAAVDFSGRISFSGFCEPLLTRNLEDYIAYARTQCPQITIEIVSNGDHVNLARLKSLFAAGLNNIRISLYDGPHQDDKFLQMQRESGLSDKEFILRKRYLSPEEQYGLTINNRAGAVHLVNDKIQVKALDKAMAQPCHYPFYKMLVDYDGSVFICSNDWLKKRVVGNIKDETIFAIWSGDRFNIARRRLGCSNREFAPCNKCDVNGLYNGKTHFDAWMNFYAAKES